MGELPTALHLIPCQYFSLVLVQSNICIICSFLSILSHDCNSVYEHCLSLPAAGVFDMCYLVGVYDVAKGAH